MTETVDSLKQRLVGAFVIVTLAIIFLPMIFDKPHVDDSVVIVPVPPKPEFRTFEISKPSRPEFEVLKIDPDTGKVAKDSQVSSPKQSVPLAVATGEQSVVEKSLSKVPEAKSKEVSVKTQVVKSEPVKKVVKTEVKTERQPTVSHLPIFKNVWMVQLGTFSNVKNAYSLRDKLRKDGFDGHTKAVKLNGKPAVRVFTGPFVKKREAIKVKKRLDKKYKVDSRVIFFDA